MTQAVNLANFANSVDSSGGVAPTVLNAAVPITKGGTGQATASAARTALGVDYTTIFNIIYPVGSIYSNATNGTNPATLLGFGTWVSLGAARTLVGYSSGDPLFGTAGNTGGSRDAITVSHTHTLSGLTTGSAGAHSHVTYWNYYDGGAGTGLIDPVNPGTGTYQVPTNTAGAHTHTLSGDIASTGSSGTNANLQPYLVVYMWQRTA